MVFFVKFRPSLKHELLKKGLMYNFMVGHIFEPVHDVMIDLGGSGFGSSWCHGFGFGSCVRAFF